MGECTLAHRLEYWEYPKLNFDPDWKVGWKNKFDTKQKYNRQTGKTFIHPFCSDWVMGVDNKIIISLGRQKVGVSPKPIPEPEGQEATHNFWFINLSEIGNVHQTELIRQHSLWLLKQKKTWRNSKPQHLRDKVIIRRENQQMFPV